MDEPEWSARDRSKASDARRTVVRLGYLRKGDTAMVKPEVVKKSNCPEGWYELVPSGNPP